MSNNDDLIRMAELEMSKRVHPEAHPAQDGGGGAASAAAAAGAAAEDAAAAADDGLQPLSLLELYRFATWGELASVFVGLLCTAIAGCSMPAMNLVFGEMMNDMSGNPANIMAIMDDTLVLFAILGPVSALFFFLGWYLVPRAAAILANRLRVRFIGAVLRQDMVYFDEARAGAIVAAFNDDSEDMREGMAQKLAEGVQGVTALVSSFAVSFYFSWRLTLVILAVSPVFGIGMQILTAYGSKDALFGKKEYETAGAIAEETLGAMRTVMSFAGEVVAARRYEGKLRACEGAAIRQGKYAGLGMAFIWAGMWGMFAVGFWYAAELVSNSKVDAMAAAPLPAGFWTAPQWAEEASLAKLSGFCDYQDGYMGRGSWATHSGAALDTCACDLPWSFLAEAVGKGEYVSALSPVNLTAAAAENVVAPNCGCAAKATAEGSGGGGGLSVGSGCVSGGMTVMVFFNILVGAMMAAGIGPALSAIKKGRLAGARIYRVIDRVPAIDPEAGGARPAGGASGRIVLKDVHFQYPTAAHKVFGGLDLDIAPGETVALVGESGSGKSTVARLVSRFYDPDEGSVSIGVNGGASSGGGADACVDAKQLDVAWLRSNIGLVSQEPLLFDASIADNIAFGVNPPPPRADIEAAARTANAHDFILAFPDGYDTKCGPRGSKLSGGQKQRVAIARALVRKPKILVLDEATSALDNESEKIVQSAIDNLVSSNAGSSGATCIVIAHRLSTIRNADRIVVLGSKEGTGSAVRGSCLVEQGTHAELLEKEGGLYRALVAAGSGSEAAAPAAVAPTATAPTAAAAAAAAAASSSSSSGGDLVLAVAADADDEDEDAATAGGKKKKKKKKEVEEKEELYEVEKARIWAYSKPETPLIYAGTVAALFSGIVWPACGALMGLMIDFYYSPDVAQVRSKGEIMAWAFGGLALVNFCSQFCQNYLFEIVGERMARRLRAAYFRALLRQELAWHEQPENSVGTLGARLSTDVKLVRLVAGQSLAATVMSMTSLLAGFGIAFYASWRFTLAFIALFPLLAITEGINWALMQGTETAVRNELALISGVFSEYVSGIREVQSFALEPIVIRGVTETMQTKVLRLATKQAFSRGVSMFFVMFVQMNVYTIAFWMGGRLIADGHLNFQSFSVALWAMAMGASGMGTAAGWIGDAAKAKAATSRIFELLDRVPAIDVNPWCEATDPGDPAAVGPRPAATEAPAAIPEAAFHGAVELRGVRFAYPTRQTATVFDGLNLAIPAGQTAALVGSSGCGKSTVIQLLERFYDPAKAVVDAGSGGGGSDGDGGGGGSDGDDNGSVCIDGVDIKTLDVKWLRDHVGLVGQEPVLFDASVADNIAFGKPDATRAEIEAAAKAANAHEFIEAMAQGYDTNVGARGGKVSGGQKQRIAIARAIIKRPRILLLDEATSALDNESEKIVQASLDALIADKDVRRTTIMIAHRLTTIRNADCIYVLENSGGGAVVVETGTHDELVAKNGKYAKLQQAYAQE